MTTTNCGTARTVRNIGLALLVLGAAAAGAQAPAAGFVERFKAATAAYEAKDYARMEAELLEALKARPAHPTATYNLACARALRGDAKGAVKTLDELADMGLSFDPGSDADLASLKQARGFASVRRAFARNRDEVGQPERAFRLRSPTFIPEGLAYDERTQYFFVGSVHERRIQRVRRDDTEEDFVKPGAGGLWAPLGMVADSRRGLLWVASTAVPEMQNADAAELGRSAVLAYDLDSGAPKHRFVLDDGAPHALGDLLVLRDGPIYTTDSRGGVLYSVDPGSGKFTAVTKPGELASPQGLVLSRDGKRLLVADYTQGLFSYELKSRTLQRLEVSPGASVYGIDGLYRHGDDLIAVQNGIRPHRIVRLRLADRGKRVRRVEVLAANHKTFDEPTLGAVVRDHFYFIANSHWGRFDANHRLPPNDPLTRPIVMRLTLGGADGMSGQGAEPGLAPAPAAGPALPLPCLPGQNC